MSKRTSKSASGTRGTSSPSGTSGRTVATAGAVPSPGANEAAGSEFSFLIESVQGMTAAEFRRSLIQSGIVDGDGKLAAKYRRR